MLLASLSFFLFCGIGNHKPEAPRLSPNNGFLTLKLIVSVDTIYSCILGKNTINLPVAGVRGGI